MFKLNVLKVLPKSIINNQISNFAYIVKSFVWNGRLGHVNFNSFRRLIDINLISKFHFDANYIDMRCVWNKKLPKHPFLLLRELLNL